ncbi:Creatinase/aminopeptidase [Stipitochalara longipes BDJ]|nr:Creatinase/aminopeptidase [Stipitochalara longipes BDJ]
MEGGHYRSIENDRLICGVRAPVFHARLRRVLTVVFLCLSITLLSALYFDTQQPRRRFPSSSHIHSAPNLLTTFEACSINSFLSTGLLFLDFASPLPVSEFVTRRNNLAKALMWDGIDAFIVEPGYTFQYYANISQPDWEVWEPEERPFLMIIQPYHDSEGEIKARTRFLLPSFEVRRAQLLNMPLDEEMHYIQWEEHWNPYQTLLESWASFDSFDDESPEEIKKPKVMVDEEMRDFIQRGLGENGFDVVGLSGEVEKVKQVKTEREIGILRAVNTGTVEAVRAVRGCMYLGLSEDEVKEVLDNTMRAGGLEPFFDIVLFDGNAANPHGGTNGSKVLEATTFVLIDVGAHLHGYSSDICRTFFPPQFPQPTSPSPLSQHPHSHATELPTLFEKVLVWDIVLDAQTASLKHLKPGQSAASVDLAARNEISSAGYGPYFTHRVGHGIGIKAHESPYLHQENNGSVLRTGMVFTLEPGVYLPDKFGVRHEDIFLIKDDGEAECLSGTRAVDAWNP